MSTMLSLGAHNIILSRRRLRRMTSCASGLKTFERGSQSSHFLMRNVWTTRSSLGWCPSFTSPPIVRNVVQIIRSTMNLVQVEGIWKGLSEHGSDYKVEGVLKTKVRDIGAMQWMTSLAIGTGRNSFALVGVFIYLLYVECSQLIWCRSTVGQEIPECGQAG